MLLTRDAVRNKNDNEKHHHEYSEGRNDLPNTLITLKFMECNTQHSGHKSSTHVIITWVFRKQTGFFYNNTPIILM